MGEVWMMFVLLYLVICQSQNTTFLLLSDNNMSLRWNLKSFLYYDTFVNPISSLLPFLNSFTLRAGRVYRVAGASAPPALPFSYWVIIGFSAESMDNRLDYCKMLSYFIDGSFFYCCFSVRHPSGEIKNLVQLQSFDESLCIFTTYSRRHRRRVRVGSWFIIKWGILLQ